jgi:hypothetical protein
MEKRYHLPAQNIAPLAVGRGGCIASDRITVDGARVGFMYREPLRDSQDSGWNFFSGDESQEFANNASNFGIFDVNTIANYDRDIIPHLDSPAYSAFERDRSTGQFRPTAFPA